MVEFKKFIDAYAEVYNLQHQERRLIVTNAIRHLSNILEKVENFRTVCTYIKDFVDHYDCMKEYHLEAEIKNCMEHGDSFFDACREWDI